jgi:hypothetical protein
MGGKTLHYLDDFTDEIMPCAPTLEAWGEWLSRPDASWPHDVPADGDTFSGYTALDLGSINAWLDEGGALCHDPIPEGASWFAVRTGFGGGGWGPTLSGDSPGDACRDLGLRDDDTCELACVSWRPGKTLYAYRADPPRLVEVVSQ